MAAEVALLRASRRRPGPEGRSLQEVSFQTTPGRKRCPSTYGGTRHQTLLLMLAQLLPLPAPATAALVAAVAVATLLLLPAAVAAAVVAAVVVAAAVAVVVVVVAAAVVVVAVVAAVAAAVPPCPSRSPARVAPLSSTKALGKAGTMPSSRPTSAGMKSERRDHTRVF